LNSTARTISSREFTRDVAAAKQARASGPVFITDRGTPAHVFVSIEEYRRRLAWERPSLLEAMDALERCESTEPLRPERTLSDGSGIPCSFDNAAKYDKEREVYARTLAVGDCGRLRQG